MMIRILCLSVLVLLFCTDIDATSRRLTCHVCRGRICRKQIACRPGQVCMSAAMAATYRYGKWVRYHFRSCTSPSYCPKMGKRGIVSIGVGSQVFVANVKCCNSNLCNKRLQRYPKIPSGNGMKCLFCNNMKDRKNCRVKECLGKQTHCMQVQRYGRKQSGCATENFCHKTSGGYRYAVGFAGLIRLPAVCQKPKPEPTTVKPTTVKPTTVKPTTVKPTTVKPTTVKPTTVKPTTVKPTTVKPTTVKPTTVKPTTVKPTTVKPTTVKPTTVYPTTVKPTTVKPTTVEPTTVEPTTVYPTTTEPTTVEPTTVKPTTVEPTTVEPTTVYPTTTEPTTVEPTTVEPTTVEPTTVEPTTDDPMCGPIETTPEPTLPPCGRKG